MKSSSRTLLIFGAIIGLLVVVTIILVLTIPQGVSPLLPPDTPEGVVQRYILAIEAGDYLTANSYLSLPAVTDGKTPYPPLLPPVGPTGLSDHRVTLGKSVISGDQATVEVTVEVFQASGPFANPVRSNQVTFFLKRDGGSWKVTSPMDVWFLYY